MEVNLTQREFHGTNCGQHSQRRSLTRTLRQIFPEYSDTSRYNNDINAISSSVRGELEPLLSTEDLSENPNYFQRPPPRPKHFGTLIFIAIFDLIITSACALFSMHKDSWNNSWDLVSFGIFRIIVALGVTSSVWIRDLGWILGGACGTSSLYIIFKTNFLVQSKHPFEGFLSIFLLTSFFFSQIYWIAFILVTDKKRRTYYLRDNIFFGEEESSPLNTLRRGFTSDSNTQSYGATTHDNLDVLINDGKIASSKIDILAAKSNYNTIETSSTSRGILISTSLPIPIASSAASSGGSAKSLNRFKKKMKLQDGQLPLHKRKSRNIVEDIQDDEQLKGQENNNGSRILTINANDDPLLFNDDYGDGGLIVTSIGHGGSFKDRQSIYFQPPKEDILDFRLSALDDESDEENNGDSSDSNDELENRRKKSTACNIEINPSDKKVSTSFEKVSLRKYPSESLDNSNQTNFARGDDDFVGSAPVRGGRWSMFKRRKNELNVITRYLNRFDDLKDKKSSERPEESIEIINSKDNNNYGPIMFPNSSLLTAALSSELPLKSSESIEIINSKDNNNYGPIMSSNSSLLTAALSSELSLKSNSKIESSDSEPIEIINSKNSKENNNSIMSPSLLAAAFNSELYNSEKFDEQKGRSSKTSSISKHYPDLMIKLPPTASPINHSNFTPKSSSPLASRIPILASTDDNEEEKVTQDSNSFKSNILEKQIDHSRTSEGTNVLLTPIVEESNPLTLKGNPYSLSTTKNIYKDIEIDSGGNDKSNRKPNHSREPSNPLQMLFVDIQNNKEISSNLMNNHNNNNSNNNNNNSNNNNNNNNLEINNDNNDRTLFTKSFNIAVKNSWNNEFNEAERIFNRFKNGIPRWNVAYTEMQLIKHLMTGQTSDNENPELTNALVEAEKLAIKVCENKDDFETSFLMFRTDIWKAHIKPNSSPSEDEAGFASLRANYRWDCELAMADILLFHAILQVIGGSEIKGAFNLRKAWKTYSKVRDEIDRIKGDAGKSDIHKHDSSSSSSRWSLGGSILGRGSLSSMVGFGGIRNHHQDGSSATLDGINNSVEIYSHIEDCLEFGIGVFYFIVSIFPGSFQSILKAIGFNAEREQGIQMLENCYSRDGAKAPFAALFLLVNYLFLPRGLVDPTPSLNKAGVIAKECVKKYPTSSPFLFLACQQARKTGQIKDAINHITNGIRSCEMIGVTSTNYRFEKGMTYLINLDFTAAKNIFELLFYGNTIVFTGKNGSIRLHGSIHGSIHGSSRLLSRDGSSKGDNSLLQFFEFELRPFCGLCLAGCYLILKSDQTATKEALDVLKQTKAMTSQNDRNNSNSVANSIGLLGTSASGLVGFGVGGNNSSDKKEPKANRYNKFAGRHSAKDVEKNSVTPFLLFIILYLKRDIFYMPLELKKKWVNLLESTWENSNKPIDPDTNAVYLLIRGVFEKFLNTDDPTIAQKTLCECLAMETGVISETWVIPHCRYELGELFYKQFGNQEAATEQFRWILKGPRPISRGGLISRRDSTLSLASLASRASNDSNSSSYAYNPDRFKKYEFSKVLKNRCTVATDQIRTNTIQPTSILNDNSKFEQPPSPISPISPISLYHNRKKSGSTSSLLKEIQEQSLQKHHQRQSSTTTIESKKSSKNNDEGSAMFPSIFTKKHKPKSLSNEERRHNSEGSTSSSSGSKGGPKGKLFSFFK